LSGLQELTIRGSDGPQPLCLPPNVTRLTLRSLVLSSLTLHGWVLDAMQLLEELNLVDCNLAFISYTLPPNLTRLNLSENPLVE
jgi:hypothetical protein